MGWLLLSVTEPESANADWFVSAWTTRALTLVAPMSVSQFNPPPRGGRLNCENEPVAEP